MVDDANDDDDGDDDAADDDGEDNDYDVEDDYDADGEDGDGDDEDGDDDFCDADRGKFPWYRRSYFFLMPCMSGKHGNPRRWMEDILPVNRTPSHAS